jgi:hypothetical protein
MKKISFLLALVFLIAFSCRKKEERDYNSAANAPPPPGHCSNMVFDEDELGTDCGGEDCSDCEFNEAPCNNTSNKIYINNGVIAQNFSVTSSEIIESSGNWTFNAYTGGGTTKYLRFTFNGKPNVLTTYTGTADSFDLEAAEVYIIFYDPTNGDKIGTGDVYFTITDGVYRAISCDYSFHEWGQGTPADTQWFNVSFN